MMNGDSSSARVDGGLTSLTSFGIIKAEPLAPEKSIVDALVDKGAEAPKPCLLPVKMRTPTAAGGSLPAGTASTAMRTIFPLPPLWNFCSTKDMSFRTTTSIQA